MNLSKLSIKQLQALAQDAETEIKKRRKESKKETLAEIKKLAQQHGFSLSELVEPSRVGKAKGRPEKRVKYRHPEDPNKTWAGQGRQPNWIKEWLASDKSLEELAAS